MLVYSNYAGYTFTINGGVFHACNNGALFRSGKAIYLNGGTFYNRYVYADYAFYNSGSQYHLGAGKVVYIAGQKSDFDFTGSTVPEGRLVQIGDSDADFITATITSTEGGTGRFWFRNSSYTAQEPTSAKFKKNVALDIPVHAIPTSADYIFKGWSNVMGTTLARTDTVVTSFRVAESAVAIKANFALVSYEVTFDLQEHGEAIAAQEVEKGAKVTKPVDPTAEGFTFGGWYKEAECTNAWDFDNDLIDATTILYAKWSDKATDIEPIRQGQDLSRKRIKNGQLLIERDGRTYNAQGTEVK